MFLDSFFFFNHPDYGFHTRSHSWSKVTARTPIIKPCIPAGGRSGVGQKEHSSLLTQPKRGSFGSPTQHLMSYWSKYKYVTVVHCKKDWKFRDFS